MRILTLSSVYPNPAQPVLGLFVERRARMLGERLEVRVVAPVPWSPVDGLARRFRPGYRPASPGEEVRNGLKVSHPAFLCVPGLLKGLDGALYYRSLVGPLERLRRELSFDLIDAHFAYPDGVAAALLAKRFGVPFTVTLRGTEVPYSRSALRRPQLRWVLRRATAVISVSSSLARLAEELGCAPAKIQVIPNGVDTSRFRPLDREACRRELGLPAGARVLLTVGGLVERKGFHRVIEVLPELRRRIPDLVYLIVGGPSVEGDFSGRLSEQVTALGIGGAVRFEGAKGPDELSRYYSAADVFVLASSNEGWANVLLESLACGTPVVATDVGGSREVIADDRLGRVLPFGSREALVEELERALTRQWDRDDLIAYARDHTWGRVADRVVGVFAQVLATDVGRSPA